jgi:hypothetical protein
MGREKKKSIAFLVGLVALTFGLVAQIGQIGPFTKSAAQTEADQLGTIYLNWLSAKCARANDSLVSRDRLISTAQALEQEAVRLKRDPDLRREVGHLVQHTTLRADLGWVGNGTEVDVSVDGDNGRDGKAPDVTVIHFDFYPVPYRQCERSDASRRLYFTQAEPFFTDQYGNPYGLE